VEAGNAFHLPAAKMEVLYNPCPVVMPSVYEEREKYILFAGTLTHRKGYDDLIKAFSAIADKHPEWRLKLAGNGEIENGKRLANELGIDNRVDFLGWVNGADKDIVFRKASIYCLPSYSEGFPMGVLDAWAYHLPVVTTPVGGIPDVGIDGVNMMLFTPGDIEALRNRLTILMEDDKCYRKMASASHYFAEHKFNIRDIAGQLYGIYDSLIR
ncbi:MAG: glycosyltransferase, partial [Muribaculaceae bacterium]|nr:glycosyltransferase [Muribaculaceae bacterium]